MTDTTLAQRLRALREHLTHQPLTHADSVDLATIAEAAAEITRLTADNKALMAELASTEEDRDRIRHERGLYCLAKQRAETKLAKVEAERDEARSEVARYWTSADIKPWCDLAEEKGLGHFGKKLKGMFSRAMRAEDEARREFERAESLSAKLAEARKRDELARIVIGDLLADHAPIGLRGIQALNKAVSFLASKGERDGQSWNMADLYGRMGTFRPRPSR